MSSNSKRRINPFWDDKYDNTTGQNNKNKKVYVDNDGYDDNMQNDNMTASYSEISQHMNFPDTEDISDSDYRRDSCDLNSSNSEKDIEDFNNDNDNDEGDVSMDKLRERPASLVCDKAFPYNLEGTVSKDGDMTHFVAENLEYKIKLSSPVTKKDLGQPSSLSRNSTPSTSGLLPRQFLLSQVPQIDSNVLNDIELEAQNLAASVDNLTENLCNLLHSISSITAENVEIHKNSVNKLTDSMDANIKSMYTIMAKTEEISKSMKPTEQVANKIRELKRLVDILESKL